MKIERISDKQIRCTLTGEDLAQRGMSLSELSYGTENARNLFREMLQTASSQVGFDVDDTPLMMEAIPLSTDNIMLIITKVDDPEELDARFSHFSPAEETPRTPALSAELLEGAEKIFQMISGDTTDPASVTPKKEENLDFAKLFDTVQAIVEAKPAGQTAAPADAGKKETKTAKPARSTPALRLFAFPDLDSVIDAAKASDPSYRGESALMKDSSDGTFYLMLRESEPGESSFIRCCNRMAEYGRAVRAKTGTEAYFLEHYEVILADNALKKLSAI